MVVRKYAPKGTELQGLESEARQAKRGLWVDHDPVPPWEYRALRLWTNSMPIQGTTLPTRHTHRLLLCPEEFLIREPLPHLGLSGSFPSHVWLPKG